MVPAAISCRSLYHQLRRWARQSHGIAGPDICATLPGGVNVVFRISNCFCRKGWRAAKAIALAAGRACVGHHRFIEPYLVLLVELDPRAASRPRNRDSA